MMQKSVIKKKNNEREKLVVDVSGITIVFPKTADLSL